MPYQESPLSKRPTELLSPDLGAGTGLPSGDEIPTSEGFEGLPFYDRVNSALLINAPVSGNVIDVGAGIGTVVNSLFRLGKISHPFRIALVDLNEGDLGKARSRLLGFVNQAAEDSMTFLRRSANELMGIAEEGSVDLITAFNSIHLYDDPKGFFSDAWRMLKPGSELLVNTAYATDAMFPDPMVDGRAWGKIVLGARAVLRRQGHGQVPKPTQPRNLLTTEQYEQMAQEAGFLTVTDVLNVDIPLEEAKKLFRVPEFARGIVPMPELALGDLQDILEAAVEEPLNRGWFLMRAIKPWAMKPGTP